MYLMAIQISTEIVLIVTWILAIPVFRNMTADQVEAKKELLVRNVDFFNGCEMKYATN